MTTPKEMTTRAWLELIALSVIWGASFFSIAIALREMGPLTSVLHRVFWAALLLWIIAFARGAPIPRGWRVWGAFLVMGFLNNAAPFTLMAWGQTQIETGLVSIFNASTAIFGVVVAAIFLADERLTARKALAVGFGFAGVVSMVGWRELATFDPRSVAQLAVALGAFSYALAGVWARKKLGDLPPIINAAGMLTGATLLMTPVSIIAEGVPSLAISVDAWLAVAYFAGLGTAGAYLLYYRVLGMAGAGNLLLCTLLVAPVAIVLGWAFLGERLDSAAFVGLGLIAIALLILDGRIPRAARAALAARLRRG